MKIAAVLLIVLGLLALIYGGFTYSREVADVTLGPMELEVRERQRVNVPLWSGVVAVVVGTLLLLVPARRA
jgi:uncharacterized membrane protein YidH (DUF202 family)